MKLEPVYLDELNTQSKDYKVRVTVAEKGRPRESPKKPGLVFQTLIMEDEKKNKMRCALFGEQIKAYEDILKPTGKYEISRAPIGVVDDQFKFNLEELPYQMTIGQQTVVQRLNPEAGPIIPMYQPLSTIPRTADPDSKFDVVVVVLFVEEQPRMITNSRGRESPVREIVVTDTRFNVVGFTSLRAQNTSRGFILSTTMSTQFIHEPQGDKANVLREWAKVYPQVLLDRQARVLTVRYPSEEKKIYTIAGLRNKKPSNTMQEEVAWIRVTIPNAELNKIHAYAGCHECSKRTNLPVGSRYRCTVCRKTDTVSAHKVTFKFEAMDDTGAMSFTTFNDDTEKLFRMSAAEISSMKNTISIPFINKCLCSILSSIHKYVLHENLEAFAAIQEILSTKPFLIKVGPTKELSMNSVLIWTLKSVEIEDEAEQPKASSPSSAMDTNQGEAVTTEQERKLQRELMLEERLHGKKPLVMSLTPSLLNSKIQQPEMMPELPNLLK
uniref:Replication factor A C-terminal domain-containing protein n=1 Tax=Chenopodium quinoa TaxID=63459 RepID=A0A803NDD2_CHEQI